MWRHLVPKTVAVAQEHWEKRRAVVRMRRAGFTLHVCAKKFGISRERVRQIVLRRIREERYGVQSPVERWMNDKEDLARLAASRQFVGEQFYIACAAAAKEAGPYSLWVTDHDRRHSV